MTSFLFLQGPIPPVLISICILGTYTVSIPCFLALCLSQSVSFPFPFLFPFLGLSSWSVTRFIRGQWICHRERKIEKKE